MKRLLFLLCLLGLCLCGSTGAADTHVVTMDGLAFQPSAITIKQGDSVEWSNIDARFFGGIPHTTTSGTSCVYDGTGWDSGTVRLGNSYTETFNVPGTYAYFCEFHCVSTGMTGTVIVEPVEMAAPSGQELIAYLPVGSPLLSADPFVAMPLGLGSIADGGATITIRVQTVFFAAPVDVYLAIEYGGVLLMLTPTGLEDYATAGLVPWRSGVTDMIDETPLGMIPVSALPAGSYTFFFGVLPATPSGGFPYYIWQTTVSVP